MYILAYSQLIDTIISYNHLKLGYVFNRTSTYDVTNLKILACRFQIDFILSSIIQNQVEALYNIFPGLFGLFGKLS